MSSIARKRKAGVESGGYLSKTLEFVVLLDLIWKCHCMLHSGSEDAVWDAGIQIPCTTPTHAVA